MKLCILLKFLVNKSQRRLWQTRFQSQLRPKHDKLVETESCVTFESQLAVLKQRRNTRRPLQTWPPCHHSFFTCQGKARPPVTETGPTTKVRTLTPFRVQNTNEHLQCNQSTYKSRNTFLHPGSGLGEWNRFTSFLRHTQGLDRKH